MIKYKILPFFGMLGGWIAAACGGWSDAMTTLLLFMIIDYVTGLIVAGVFHKSKKTKNGKLESKAGFKGLIRKFISFIFVILAVRLDMLLNINYCQYAVIITLIANETISITENCGLIGIPIPEPIKKAISLLDEKTEASDGN